MEEHKQGKDFTLDELCTLTGFGKRTIRYYIQIGLVPRPVGETRAAIYKTRHLEQLLTIKRLSGAGVSLDGIRAILDNGTNPIPAAPSRPGTIEVRSHLTIADGLELQINPQTIKLTPEQMHQLVNGIMDIWQTIIGQTEGKTSTAD